MSTIDVAALILNLVIGDLAQDNLMRIAEENTALEPLNMQAMMRRGQSMDTMPGMQQPKQVTPEVLTSPEGLSSSFPMLVGGG